MEVSPIFGQQVKGIMHVKIKDKVSLCAECSRMISMEQSMLQFQSVESIKGHLIYRKKNKSLFNNFSTTNKVKCGTAVFREDSQTKKWYSTFQKNETNPAIFNYDEIVDYELTEDGNKLVKGGLGAAVAGGVLLGSLGAVVGSNVGKKKSKTVIKCMKLRTSLNGKYKNQIMIELLPIGSKVKTGRFTYNVYKTKRIKLFLFWTQYAVRP